MTNIERAIIPFEGSPRDARADSRALINVRDLVDTSDDESVASEHSTQELDCTAPLVKSLMKTMPREHVDSLRLVTTAPHAPHRRHRKQHQQGGGDALWATSSNPPAPHNAEAVDPPDFLGSTASLRDLFKLPYTPEAVTVGLHRVGRTLVVDGGVEDALSGAHARADAEHAELHLPSDEGPAGGDSPKSTDRAAGGPAAAAAAAAGEVEEAGGAAAADLRPACEERDAVAAAAECAGGGAVSVLPPLAWSTRTFAQPPHPQGWQQQQQGSSSGGGGGSAFARQFHWNLHEMKLLLGSDQLVAGTSEHPRVSVKLHDDGEELTLCTCLDYYLDNVMENIPELALCLRSKGYIQGCRLIRTHDIPRINGGGGGGGGSGGGGGGGGGTGDGLFDPRVVELNATLLLRFLQQNCSREGGTYLLRRAAGGGAVQLYDLQALSGERQKRWRWLLAMMCYRFALRISHHLAGVADSSMGLDGGGGGGAWAKGTQTAPEGDLREQLQRRRRRLLHNSLQLLSELAEMGGGRHETIAAAVQEQIAETYMADGAGAAGGRGGSGGGGGSSSSAQRGDCCGSGECDGRAQDEDLGKAKEHLAEGIAILRGVLSQQQEAADAAAQDARDTAAATAAAAATDRATAQHGHARRRSGSLGHRGGDVIVLGESQPVAVMKRGGGGGGGGGHAAGNAGTAACGFMFGEFAVEWDSSAVPERERALYSSTNGGASDAGSSSDDDSAMEDPATAVYLVSRQLLALQDKLVTVTLLEADRRITAASEGSGDLAALTAGIATLRAAAAQLSDAAATLDALHVQQQHDGSAPPPPLSAATSSRPASPRAATGDLGALYAGSLSEALAANAAPAPLSGGAESAAGTSAGGSAAAADGEGEEGDAMRRRLRAQSARLAELLGDAAHALLVWARAAPAAAPVDAPAAAAPAAAAAGVTDALAAALAALSPPLDVEALDPCGDAHGRAWSRNSRVRSRSSGGSSSSTAAEPGDGVPLRCLRGTEGEVAAGAELQWRAALTARACYARAAAEAAQCDGGGGSSGGCGRAGRAAASLACKVGDACNCLGQLTSAAARRFHSGLRKGEAAQADEARLYASCLTAAEAWFVAAGRVFAQQTRDAPNSALVLLNLASIVKLRPRIGAALGGSAAALAASDESACEGAAELCSAAHAALASRDAAPALWDQISAELALTSLMLGAGRRARVCDGSSGVDAGGTGSGGGGGGGGNAQWRAWRERNVLAPLQRALRIYTDIGDTRQAAAARYQLGLYHAADAAAGDGGSGVAAAAAGAAVAQLASAAAAFAGCADCAVPAVIAAVELHKTLGEWREQVAPSVQVRSVAVGALLRGGAELAEDAPLAHRARKELPSMLLALLQALRDGGGGGDSKRVATAKVLYRRCLTAGEEAVSLAALHKLVSILLKDGNTSLTGGGFSSLGPARRTLGKASATAKPPAPRAIVHVQDERRWALASPAAGAGAATAACQMHSPQGGTSGQFSVEVPTAPVHDEAPIQRVLIAVKSYDVVQVVRMLRPRRCRHGRLGPSSVAVILCQQPAVLEELDAAADCAGVTCVAGTTMHSAYATQRFHIVHTCGGAGGAGDSWFGLPRGRERALSAGELEGLVAGLGRAQLGARLDEDIAVLVVVTREDAARLSAAGSVQLGGGAAAARITVRLWERMAVACGVLPLTALFGVSNGRLRAMSACEPMLRLVAEEVAAVMAARGFGAAAAAAATAVDGGGGGGGSSAERKLSALLLEAALERLNSTTTHFSSMSRDVRVGRRTEIDYFNGFVAREARRLGLSAPVNETLCSLMAAKLELKGPHGDPTFQAGGFP
ncbi:hypothetical protein JKP88DRAFT_350838 [Tribonema minus]|uniref:Ketopantoate reductase C-terminal domain-containing protein n=1 Tax=Tribonema minus TaxID=303371 RepID=A0A835YNX7_9STRA|nr:hypothetical protein JKP88DRAFT_350838 [Tribonema minus]